MQTLFFWLLDPLLTSQIFGEKMKTWKKAQFWRGKKFDMKTMEKKKLKKDLDQWP